MKEDRAEFQWPEPPIDRLPPGVRDTVTLLKLPIGYALCEVYELEHDDERVYDDHYQGRIRFPE